MNIIFVSRKKGAFIMHIYLDDLREVPKGFIVARSYEECVSLLKENEIETISLDHDLGTNKTGYDVCLYMVENEIYPKEIYIHSANPVGQKNMIQLLNRYMPIETKLYTRLGDGFIKVFRN